MTVLWIILGFVAFFALLLALPLRIFLSFTEETGLQYRVKYAVFPIADSKKPEKPAANKKQRRIVAKSKKALGSAARSLRSFPGLEDVSSAANFKRAIAEKGLLETLRGVTETVRSLLQQTGQLFKKGVFKKFELHIVCGGSDPAEAATQYGAVCAAVYPLLTLLDSAMKCKHRKVDIRCDFDTEEIRASFEGQVNYRPWHFVCFVCGLLWRYIKSKNMKEGYNDE